MAEPLRLEPIPSVEAKDESGGSKTSRSKRVEPAPAENLEQLMERVAEEKYSTKSVHGSSQNEEFSKYYNARLSQLFESIDKGRYKVQTNLETSEKLASCMEQHSEGKSGDGLPKQMVNNSEIFALKREIDRQNRKPVHLNIMVTGRKGCGKTSFIKMLLNYVGLTLAIRDVRKA